VLCRGEAVKRCGAVRPRLDVLRLDLDSESAGAADQVMVVPRRACAIQGLALRALQRIGITRCRESGKCTVDGGQTDTGVLFPERRMQTLRAHETTRIGQRFTHSLALPCVALSHS